MESSLLQTCSAFVIPNKPLYQPCFSYTEWAREDINAPIIHICGPCAHTCFGFNPKNPERHPSIDILDDTRELKKPFVCGCKGLRKTGHKCYWASCDRSKVIHNKEAEDMVVPIMEIAWRNECRSFLEDLAFNGDAENANERKNAKEVEKLTKQLRRQQELFDQYFEEETQNAARRCIPISKLVRRAKMAYKNEQDNSNSNIKNSSLPINAESLDKQILELHQQQKSEALPSTFGFYDLDENNNNIYQALSDVNLHDHILKQLLYWFKHDFFKWVDQPLCESCGEKTFSYRPPKGTDARIAADNVVPTPEEKQNWATVIELYECRACAEQKGQVIRFPRYNKAKRLLTWRKGRCGEWANCFALCCIALGFETRFVLDLTDHVWVEVYSTCRGRWVHLDPCENAFDAPLMYSKGWGKKLNYIFAISQTEVVDVTRRYTESPLSLETRTKVSEMTLSFLVRGMNWFANKRCPVERLPLLEQRAHTEQEQLSQAGGAVIVGEDLSGATNKGRQSGAVGWTVLRDESGGTGGVSSVVGESTGNSLINQGVGRTSASAHGIPTLDSISTQAGNFFAANEKNNNIYQFAEEATINNNNDDDEDETRPKWIWKGGKKNVVKILKNNNEDTQKQEENWFAFRFASGCGGCNLAMIPPSNSANTNTSVSAAPPTCSLPAWTTQPNASLPTNQENNKLSSSSTNQQFFPYPSKTLVNSPRLPVPLSAERFTSTIDEFSASLWFTPYFSVPKNNDNSPTSLSKTFRGIVGFSVGRTFRVDVSWEFSIVDADASNNNINDDILAGDFTTALSIKHVELPTMSSELTKIQKNTKKWNENFSSVEPVTIWDSTVRSNVHSGMMNASNSSSTSSTSENQLQRKRRVNFRKVQMQELSASSLSSSTDSPPSPDSSSSSFYYVLDSESALQLFSSLDKQGALTAIVYQRLDEKETVSATTTSSPSSRLFRACSIAGTLVPVFLIDRGSVSLKLHGLETLVETVQLGW